MTLDKETTQKIQELQILEQNLQNFLAQKQAIQSELNETLNALEELKNSGDEAYKIVSGIMIKSDKKTLSTELEEKKKLLDLRVSSIEKQEALIEKKALSLKEEVTKVIEKSQKDKD
tara:strand:+ start:105 stop:455 length:351 start_codon:yes stop_codon:yes gene_type:complete